MAAATSGGAPVADPAFDVDGGAGETACIGAPVAVAAFGAAGRGRGGGGGREEEEEEETLDDPASRPPGAVPDGSVVVIAIPVEARSGVGPPVVAAAAAECATMSPVLDPPTVTFTFRGTGAVMTLVPVGGAADVVGTDVGVVDARFWGAIAAGGFVPPGAGGGGEADGTAAERLAPLVSPRAAVAAGTLRSSAGGRAEEAEGTGVVAEGGEGPVGLGRGAAAPIAAIAEAAGAAPAAAAAVELLLPENDGIPPTPILLDDRVTLRQLPENHLESAGILRPPPPPPPPPPCCGAAGPPPAPPIPDPIDPS